MRSFLLLTLFILSAIALSFSCGRKSGSSGKGPHEMVSADELRQIQGKEILLQIPESCAENEGGFCESWLGFKQDGNIGETHISGRASFAIEDLNEHGRFHIAVYPDCLLEERALQEQSVLQPELKAEGEDIDAKDDQEAVIVEGNGESTADMPNLLEGVESETGPEDDDSSVQPPPTLSKSPLLACRKLIAPNANKGGPVELQDPANVDENAWWVVHIPEEGHPIFVSTKPCEKVTCRTRLLLGEEGFLTAIDVEENELSLKSFWKRISGSISKSFNSIETGVADIKKQIGTNVSVSKLGNKKLYVTAALPAAKIYSALKEQGPSALALADGTLRDGAVYVKTGAKYVEKGGVAALEGAKYIAEYIMNNACYLGIMAHLIDTMGSFAIGYEAALSSGFLDFYNKATGPLSYESMASDKSSPTYIQILTIANFYALQATAVSGKFNQEKWKDIIMDIILSAFAGNIKAGYTPIIFSKMSTAICKGTDEALSAAHALVSTMETPDLSVVCLDGIRDRSISRYDNGEDMCYSLRDEIQGAANKQTTDNRITNAWKESVEGCPTDANDDGYVNLLEGIGCQKKRVIAHQFEEVGDLEIDDSTVLTNSRYWNRTNSWQATLACKVGEVAVGMCSSGKNPDCYTKTKELLCARKADGQSIVNNESRQDIYKYFNADLAMCPGGYAITEMCSSGENYDCSGYAQAIRCKSINKKYEIDYTNCELKQSTSWTGRIEATAPNQVMVGMCSSGKHPDCGRDSDATKAAMFCPLKPAEKNDGTLLRFLFSSKTDNWIRTNVGVNARGYEYQLEGFKLFSSPGTNRTAFYSCRNSTNHYASIKSGCEGGTTEATLGYVSTAKTDTAIYRCKKGSIFLVTADLSACQKDGFSSLVTLGYAPD